MPEPVCVWVRVDGQQAQAPAALSASGGFSDPSALLLLLFCLFACLLMGAREGLKQS